MSLTQTVVVSGEDKATRLCRKLLKAKCNFTVAPSDFSFQFTVADSNSINLDVSYPDEIDSQFHLMELRDMGFAVSAFTPDELDGSDSGEVEDAMVECGWNAISMLKPEGQDADE
jgi:hypothetical protein